MFDGGVDLCFRRQLIIFKVRRSYSVRENSDVFVLLDGHPRQGTSLVSGCVLFLCLFLLLETSSCKTEMAAAWAASWWRVLHFYMYIYIFLLKLKHELSKSRGGGQNNYSSITLEIRTLLFIYFKLYNFKSHLPRSAADVVSLVMVLPVLSGSGPAVRIFCVACLWWPEHFRVGQGGVFFFLPF